MTKYTGEKVRLHIDKAQSYLHNILEHTHSKYITYSSMFIAKNVQPCMEMIISNLG